MLPEQTLNLQLPYVMNFESPTTLPDETSNFQLPYVMNFGSLTTLPDESLILQLPHTPKIESNQICQMPPHCVFLVNSRRQCLEIYINSRR